MGHGACSKNIIWCERVVHQESIKSQQVYFQETQKNVYKNTIPFVALLG